MLLLWELLPLLLVLLVALAAFTFEPEAVVRLVWACVNGSFGEKVQIVGTAVVLGVIAATVWAFRPEPSATPARKKTARRPAKRAAPKQDVADAEQGDAAETPQRRKRGQNKPEAGAEAETMEPRVKTANSAAEFRT